MITADGEELFLRPADERHHGYISDSWVKEVALLSRPSRLPKSLVANGTLHLIDALIDHAHVLTTERSPGTVHGWICGVKGALFFVYVPHELRHQRIASDMIRTICGGKQ